MIGVALAKTVFQIHTASLTGELLFRKKVGPPQFLQFMASQPPALVVMEACGSAHYWARILMNAGHEVKLIAQQYVRPFVERQKNDAADAEAIVIAARQPEMRFVVSKAEAQQARAVLFRGRERLVHQRTEFVNALRATFYEFGIVVLKGIAHLKCIEEEGISLPTLVREE
ncbi:IS110 family transposase [Acidomonas methanolica]|uniref:IS110 family transposase n=1 Tax=Acidomonas methanolica TaxID=437 RepID=UPI00211A1A4E|nr:transposase [Acidomonas methanolica]MCQ9154932.1 transposase [Acidomonas methanolica]